MERRTLLEPVELRARPDGLPVLVGYAIRYDRFSKNLGGFIERAMPGSAAKTIKEQDIIGLFNHDPNNLLGRLGAHTLRLFEESDVGLRYEIDPPNTSLGRDVVELAQRGDIPGSSFGFMVSGKKGSTWTRSENGFPVRQLWQYRIRDLGPVTFPAYSGTDVALRSLAEARSLPFEELAEAAQENRLSDLLWTPEQEQRDDEEQQERPSETHRPVIRHRRHF